MSEPSKMSDLQKALEQLRDLTKQIRANQSIEMGRTGQEETDRANRVTESTITSNEIPSKRATRLRSPITRGSRAAFGVISSIRASAGRWSTVAMINMIATDQDGTREATDKELVRLQRSPQNANTTDRKKLHAN